MDVPFSSWRSAARAWSRYPLSMPGLILSATLAMAADPVVTIDDRGRVHGTAVLSVPVTELRTHLSDPAWLLQFDQSGTTVAGRRRDGACEEIAYRTPGTLWSAEFTVRQCPTPTGFEATLVRSSVISRYDSRWTLTPVAEGVRVEYELEIGVPRLVPAGWARNRTVSSVDGMLRGLVAWADRSAD
jgi:hypothetical protein